MKIDYEKNTKQKQQINIFYKYGFLINNQIFYENLHEKNTSSRLMILEMNNLENIKEINHLDGIILNYINPRMFNLNIYCISLVDYLIKMFIIENLITNTRLLELFQSIKKTLKMVFMQNFSDNIVIFVSF